MSLGEILKQLRNEKGLTQERLAKEFGLSRQTIFQYENNIRKPDFEALSKLEKFFEIRASFLLGNSDHQTLTEERFYNDVLRIDESLQDKPEEIKKSAMLIYNSLKEFVDKIIDNDKSDTSIKENRLAQLRSLIDELDTIYFSNYLPTKDLWEDSQLSELDFYRKKEVIFKKHLTAVEYFLHEAFSIRCGELYQEYLANSGQVDPPKSV